MPRIRCLGVVLVLWPAVVAAQQPKFIRVKESGGKVTALEVAVTRDANKDKSLTVDLVGVVHIGDRAQLRIAQAASRSMTRCCTSWSARRGRRCRRGARATARWRW